MAGAPPHARLPGDRAAAAALVVLGLVAVALLSAPGLADAPAPRLQQPPDGAVYPPSMAPPTWSWDPAGLGAAGPWTVEVDPGTGQLAAVATVAEPHYTPRADDWAAWRATLGAGVGRVRVRPAGGGPAATSRFGFSAHPVEGTLTFRLVTAPFHADPELRTLLRQQAVSDPAPRPLIPDLPATPCKGCHAIRRDGAAIALQVRDPHDPHTALWSPGAEVPGRLGVPRDPFGRTSGLTWTPDDRLVVAMGLDYSYERRVDGFTLTHHASDLAVVDPSDGSWSLVPGASSPFAVEDFPDVSPDGATLAFVRGGELDTVSGALDIYVVPFGAAAGDDPAARPLPGASGAGAHYFPRYSPDGRWMALVHSDGGYFARPSADLVLIPSGGGDPLPLAINSPQMDSWPSWSLDGHWLAFASRRDDPARTRIYLTEISADGRCSPPVRLPGDAAGGASYNHPTFGPPLSAPAPGGLAPDGGG